MSPQPNHQQVKIKVCENDAAIADGAVWGDSSSGFTAKIITRYGIFSRTGHTLKLASRELEDLLKRIYRDTENLVYTISYQGLNPTHHQTVYRIHQ